MNEIDRAQSAKKITLFGAVSNLFLGIIKIITGWFGRSHALVADGFHSLSDLVTDGLVLLASYYGSRKADIDHPYGHQRIETAATLFLALLLILTGLGIAYDSLQHLLSGHHEKPADYVLLIIIFSIVVKEALYQYTSYVGKKIKSNLIIANAWHHRSDAASSLVVLVGVVGALLGYAYLDSVAAIIVGFMIVKMGGSLGWSSVRELVDTGVPEDVLEEIRATILSVPGVLTVHQLRTRCMAETILVDAHILVNGRLSVSEGHYISSKVHEALLEKIHQIADVTIHVDPENDDIVPVNRELPPRVEVVAIIFSHLAGLPGVDAIIDTRLHYLEGQLQVELIMPALILEEGFSSDELRETYVKALASLDYISNVQVFFV